MKSMKDAPKDRFFLAVFDSKTGPKIGTCSYFAKSDKNGNDIGYFYSLTALTEIDKAIGWLEIDEVL